MIAVSNATKEACNSASLTYKEFIIIDNETIEINGKLTATAFNDRNFIGTFNLKSLTFETENDIDYKEKEFEYYKQVNNEAFKIGTFITTEVEDSDTNEVVKVTAMDYGLKFATPYETSLDYDSGEITMQDVLDEILTNVNIQLSSESQTLRNGNFIVDSNQFVNSEVYGDVISAIAGINGMFAVITSDDKLKLLTTNSTVTTKTRKVEQEVEAMQIDYSGNPDVGNRQIQAYYEIDPQKDIIVRVYYPHLEKELEIDGIRYERKNYDFEFQRIGVYGDYFRFFAFYDFHADSEDSRDFINGDYIISKDDFSLTMPNGIKLTSEPDPLAEMEDGLYVYINSSCDLKYNFKDEEDYQKYVDLYFDGDESAMDERYMPRSELQLSVIQLDSEQYQEDEVIEDYTELDDKRDTHPITIVQLGMSQVQGVSVEARWEAGVTQYGEHYLILNDNPFAYTMEKRQQLAGNILEQVKGLGYSSFESKFAFKPYLEIGDKIKFRNKAGELVDSIVLKIDTDYEDITLSAPSIADATVDYSVIDTERIARRAEIIANQATGEIEMVTRQVRDIGTSVETNFQNISENFTNYYTIDQTNELIMNAENGITNTFSRSGGNNIFRNTGLWFEETKDEKLYIYPNNELYPSNETYSGAVAMYEYWTGYAKRTTEDKATNNNAILVQKGSFIQEQEVPNGNYTISFYYEKLKLFATTSVIINDVEYPLESMETKLFYTGEKNTTNDEYIVQPLVVNSRRIKIEFKSNTDDGLKVYDLMCNKGSARLVYSQNENETTTDTVNISKGITITSTNMETIFKANADGIRITKLNSFVIAYFTDKGLSTKEIVVEDEAQIVKTLWQEVGDQTWITRI